MKKLIIEVPEYSDSDGIKYNWIGDFTIKVSIEGNSIVICANKDGLMSLSNHFANLAQDEVPINSHLHFDEYNSLEVGSLDLVIQKIIEK